MMKKILISCILLFSFGASKGQYNPYFSFYPFHGAIINPAMTGHEGNFNITASHRSQWNGLNGAPVTDVITAHGPLVNPRYAIGGSIMADRIGVTTQALALIHYAYRIPVGKGRLCLGLSGGAGVLQNDWESVSVSASGDPSFTSDERVGGLMAGAGVYYYNKQLGLGLAAPLLIAPTGNEMASPSTASWIIHAGYKAHLGENSYLQPLAIVRTIPSVSVQADAGIRLGIANRLAIGVLYRTMKAFTGLVEINLSPGTRIGYAYDNGFSLPGNMGRGGHEIMLRIDIQRTVKTADPLFF